MSARYCMIMVKRWPSIHHVSTKLKYDLCGRKFITVLMIRHANAGFPKGLTAYIIFAKDCPIYDNIHHE